MKDNTASRRNFIFLLMSMIQGVLVLRPKALNTAKQNGKDLISRLETELLESSRPKREMSISTATVGDKTALYREMGDIKIPIGSMNHTGNTIWKLCDGNNGFKDICGFIVERCQITETRARRDILAFLAQLKRIGLRMLVGASPSKAR